MNTTTKHQKLEITPAQTKQLTDEQYKVVEKLFMEVEKMSEQEHCTYRISHIVFCGGDH